MHETQGPQGSVIHRRALQYVFFNTLSIIPSYRRNKRTIRE